LYVVTFIFHAQVNGKIQSARAANTLEHILTYTPTQTEIHTHLLWLITIDRTANPYVVPPYHKKE